MKILVSTFAFFILSQTAFSQSTSALFLGNSYTDFNNLPKMVADLALSAGDSLFYDAMTPGGFTLEAHVANPSSLTKINERKWDYVILQEQSQRPSFPAAQVATEVYPFAEKLDSAIKTNDSCTQTMFYMTWGRKFGDASNCMSWPPVCTYEGMDSLLRLRYTQMAIDNESLLSPVGALWHYIRDNHSSIDLYSADNSHPSLAGSYAAACSFYTMIFKKDPSLTSDDLGLSASDAANIRAAAKAVVYDSISKWTYSTPCTSGTSINEIAELPVLRVIPNPSAGSFSVNLSSISYFEIFNLEGKRLMQGATEGKIDLEGMPSGTYFLIISKGEIDLGRATLQVVR